MPSWRAPWARVRRRSPAGGSILMTSAPWSASVREQIGPTTTEVWSMTRMPASGPLLIRILQFDCGALIAVLIDAPARHPASLRRATLCAKAIADPERACEARLNACEFCLKMRLCCVDYELHRQTAILDCFRVTFMPTRIVGIVVDAMRVPRDGGITEDQGIREFESLRPGRLGGWADRLGQGIAL